MNAVTEFQRTEELPAMTPQSILQVAMDKNFDLDRIDKMMALAERFQAQKAERAFKLAVAAFKEHPPEFYADKVNTQYKSKYTSIGNMVNVVNAALGKHGLEASWDLDQSDPKAMKVTCILTHADGHERRVSLTGPLDTSGAKNPLQQVKSTITYLEIATYQAVTGVATQIGNEDDDGNGSGGGAEYITEKQVADLDALISEVKADKVKFLAYLKVESLDQILAKSYKTAVAGLEAKRRQK